MTYSAYKNMSNASVLPFL